MASLEAEENVWCDKWRYEEAEKSYQEHLAQLRCGGTALTDKACGATSHSPCKASSPVKSSLAGEIARAREHIQKSLNTDSATSSVSNVSLSRIEALEKENLEIKQLVKQLSSRLSILESGSTVGAKPGSTVEAKPAVATPSKPATTTQTNGAADDDDFDLFNDEELEVDEEAERVKEERLKAYHDKKANKPVLIAKSNIILDVKPWDDETDMAELEKCVRSIVMDGLLWGASKLVPVGYGIKKLQISCVVEDDKVSTEDLEEKIVAFEDLIQSMDIAAFNKI